VSADAGLGKTETANDAVEDLIDEPREVRLAVLDVELERDDTTSVVRLFQQEPHVVVLVDRSGLVLLVARADHVDDGVAFPSFVDAHLDVGLVVGEDPPKECHQSPHEGGLLLHEAIEGADAPLFESEGVVSLGRGNNRSGVHEDLLGERSITLAIHDLLVNVSTRKQTFST